MHIIASCTSADDLIASHSLPGSHISSRGLIYCIHVIRSTTVQYDNTTRTLIFSNFLYSKTGYPCTSIVTLVRLLLLNIDGRPLVETRYKYPICLPTNWGAPTLVIIILISAEDLLPMNIAGKRIQITGVYFVSSISLYHILIAWPQVFHLATSRGRFLCWLHKSTPFLSFRPLFVWQSQRFNASGAFFYS